MELEVTEYLNRVKQWQAEMQLLRRILLECGLTESYKWKAPCYSHQQHNIAMLGNFKTYCSISFFKGILLKDDERILRAPGPNSQSVRMLTFTKSETIIAQEAIIKAYIFEAMAIEAAGLKVDKASTDELDLTQELIDKMNDDLSFRQAFEALTPGRQRGYHLFFSAAKQSATRSTRIEKHFERIMNGFGINDCVCGHSKRMPNCDGSHKFLKLN